MSIPFLPRRTATANKVPTTVDLMDGELGVNTTDRKLYIRVGAAVVELFKALTKSDVGLGNVDNTTDAAKPVSTAQQAALNLKLSTDEASEGNVGSKLIRRDVNGDAAARLYRSEFGDETTISGAMAFRVTSTVSGDNFIRFCNNTGNIRTFLGLGTAATYNVGTTGAAVALANGANQWSAVNNFSGITFTQTIAASPTDLSKQIQLWAGYGWSITGNTLNHVSAGTTHDFYTGTTLAARILNSDFAAVGTVSDVAGNVRAVPQRIANASTTVTLTDAGGHLYSGNTTNYTWTIPTNATAAFPIGSVITFVHGGSSSTKSVAGASGVVLIGADGTTGTVSLTSTRRVVTALKITTDAWLMS